VIHKNVNTSSHRKGNLVALTTVYQFDLWLKVRDMPSKLSLPRQGPWSLVWVKQVFELTEVELTVLLPRPKRKVSPRSHLGKRWVIFSKRQFSAYPWLSARYARINQDGELILTHLWCSMLSHNLSKSSSSRATIMGKMSKEEIKPFMVFELGL